MAAIIGAHFCSPPLALHTLGYSPKESGLQTVLHQASLTSGLTDLKLGGATAGQLCCVHGCVSTWSFLYGHSAPSSDFVMYVRVCEPSPQDWEQGVHGDHCPVQPTGRCCAKPMA